MDVEKESDESLKTFNERNIRLLNLFKGYLKEVARPITFLDFGLSNAYISRTFKRELGSEVTIFCLEPNPLCKGLYDKYGLIQVKDIKDFPIETLKRISPYLAKDAFFLFLHHLAQGMKSLQTHSICLSTYIFLRMIH